MNATQLEILTEAIVARLTDAGEFPMLSACPDEAGCAGNCASTCPDRTQALVDVGAERIQGRLGMLPPVEGFARTIDHTLLKPEATEAEIAQLCEEAATHRFASVCVNPTYVAFCAEALRGTSVAVCTVIGFPLGATTSEVKGYEAYRAQENGATELDMVIPVGRLKSGNDDYVRNDIRAVVEAKKPGSIVKVILETSLLTDDEKVRACRLAQEAGADFVKTSTGFSTGGATEEDIRLMRRTVGASMGVKASGGIRDRDIAERMIAAGATRLGASAGIRIVRGETADGDGY